MQFRVKCKDRPFIFQLPKPIFPTIFLKLTDLTKDVVTKEAFLWSVVQDAWCIKLQKSAKTLPWRIIPPGKSER
jgi:hypothetical protein